MTRKKQADAPDMNKVDEDRPRQFHVLADNMEGLKRGFADDLDQLRSTIDMLWDVLSDQHEINQMLINRLFILESENVHVSASIH